MRIEGAAQIAALAEGATTAKIGSDVASWRSASSEEGSGQAVSETEEVI
jgi:hypothetical protein